LYEYPSLAVIDVYGFRDYGAEVLSSLTTMITALNAISTDLTSIKTDVGSIKINTDDIKTKTDSIETHVSAIDTFSHDIYNILNGSYVDVRLIYTALGAKVPINAGPTGLEVYGLVPSPSHVIVDSGTVDANISGFSSLVPLVIEGHVIVDSLPAVQANQYIKSSDSSTWVPALGLDVGNVAWTQNSITYNNNNTGAIPVVGASGIDWDNTLRTANVNNTFPETSGRMCLGVHQVP